MLCWCCCPQSLGGSTFFRMLTACIAPLLDSPPAAFLAEANVRKNPCSTPGSKHGVAGYESLGEGAFTHSEPLSRVDAITLHRCEVQALRLLLNKHPFLLQLKKAKMRVARSANKKGTGRRGPKDDADAAPRSSTRAEDAFELVSDGVAAAVDAVELAAHAGGLFFGAGLVGAHAAASRLLWAAGCAWCVYRWTFSSERAARTAFLAALAAILSVVESDTLVLATPDETEVVWLLRHLMAPALLGCIGAYSVVALGRAAGAGLASNGEKPPARHARTTRARKGPHHADRAAA